METRQYVCNSKTIKELFALTLDGITVRVRCVSSTTVAQIAKSLDWWGPKKPGVSDVLLRG